MREKVIFNEVSNIELKNQSGTLSFTYVPCEMTITLSMEKCSKFVLCECSASDMTACVANNSIKIDNHVMC